MEGGESQEVAAALAKWARGALSIAALHHSDTARGGLEATSVRAPDAEWGPTKDTDADAVLFRYSESFRSRRIARPNSYCFHGVSEYCMRAPRRGGGEMRLPGQSSGGAEWGRAGGDSWPGRHSRLGNPADPNYIARPARVRAACDREKRPPYDASLSFPYDCMEGIWRLGRPPLKSRP